MAGNGSAESKYFSVKKGGQIDIRVMGANSDQFKVELILSNKIQISKKSVSGNVKFIYTANESGEYKLQIKNLKNQKISVVGMVIIN